MSKQDALTALKTPVGGIKVHVVSEGETISEIAESKAGIIKYQTPILVGKLEDSAFNVIKDVAKYQKAPLYVVSDYHNLRQNEENIIDNSDEIVGKMYFKDLSSEDDIVCDSDGNHYFKNQQ
mgnify:CR=1 FL=1